MENQKMNCVDLHVISQFKGKDFLEVIESSEWKNLPINKKYHYLRNIVDIVDTSNINSWKDIAEKHRQNSYEGVLSVRCYIEAIEFESRFFKGDFEAKHSFLLQYIGNYISFRETNHPYLSQYDVNKVLKYLEDQLSVVKDLLNNPIHRNKRAQEEVDKYYNKLKEAYFFAKERYYSGLEDNSSKVRDLLNLFISLNFDYPNYDNGDINLLSTLPILVIKQNYINLNRQKIISFKDAKYFKDLLTSLKIQIQGQSLNIKEAINSLHESEKTEFLIYNNQLSFNEVRINLIDIFLPYFEETYLTKRKYQDFPETFLETIKERRKYDRIVEELCVKGIMKYEDEKYTWIAKHNKIKPFIEILDRKGLLNINISEIPCVPFLKLFCDEYEVNASIRSLNPDTVTIKAVNKNKEFYSFLHNTKII